MSDAELVVLDVGRAAYAPTLALQRRLVERVQARGDDAGYLVLVEHDPPVITLGRRARDEHVLLSAERLAARGIERVESRRGGDVTYHGPGQLVAYPILRLNRRRRTVHGHVRGLEEAVLRVLAAVGVSGRRRDGLTGVWVGREKIAAIGVAVSRWVTYHGLALNVSTDLAAFDAIVPCGLADVSVTSLAKLGRDVGMGRVKDLLVEALADVLGFARVRSATPDELALDTRADPAGTPRPRLPRWLRRPIPTGPGTSRVPELLDRLGLATVCQSARCPNRAECFARGTATFMILGDRCTRNCAFCAVEHGLAAAVAPAEADAVAEACRRLGLRHVVITSVTRDDLPDGGAGHFARVVRAVHRQCPAATVEILTPDFQGDPAAVDAALAGGCDVFNHNVETVPRLYPAVRPQADYDRSLAVLAHVARRPNAPLIKSGLMLGLGETRDELRQTLRDLSHAGCQALTLGQYLAPTPDHHPVARYLPPEEFAEIEQEARAEGFPTVQAGPFVRSSYHAEEMLGAGHLAGGSRRQGGGWER